MIDLSTCLFLDFEARSEVNITDVGAHAYAEHPTTEILCCAWVVGLTDEVHLWLPDASLPEDWTFGFNRWVAHNKDTERLLLRHKLGLEIAPGYWIDSATAASAAGMPRNLHDVGEALHLEVQKESRAAMLALAKPRKITKTNSSKWWTRAERPDLYEQMEAYCRRDVDVMRKAMAALPPYHWIMPAKEERLAVLTDEMNDRGVEVDLVGVAKAAAQVEAHGALLRAEFAELVPGVNPRHAPGVARALGIANSRKETVRAALKSAEGPQARALTLLKTIKTASTAKLDAFRRHACADGKIHGAMVHHGAGRTGRWSSMGVQLHNLVRGLGVSTPDWPAVDTSDDAMEKYFTALHGDVLDLFYPDPTRATAAAMRGFLFDVLRGLLSGDFSQIEARTLVAWAGQQDMIEAFRLHRDPYKLMAARVYGKALEAVTKDERFMGKIAVLGAGYGLGRHGLMAMLDVQFGVAISEEEADRIVQAYRQSSRRVVDLWYAVERLAKQVLLERPEKLMAASDVPRIGMRIVDKWLVVRLPSGRCLWYFEPELDDGRIVYWGRNPRIGGRWDRVETYGGKLVENITQAMARDVMADAMLRLDDAGFNLTFTVHDDVVAPGDASRLDEFKSIMLQAPSWWPDLPLDVEVQHKRRYQK